VQPNRNRSYTTTANGINRTTVHHYTSDTTDKPAWTADNGSYSRTINGPAGFAATLNSANNTVDWQIANLHGDIVAAHTAGTVGLAYTSITDEYGKPVTGATARYGYLGTQQRSADNPNGLITMGARVYNPETGRFLSTDPIYGGNANAYEYGTGDPVNNVDTSGQFSCTRTSYTVKKWYYWWGTWGGYDDYFYGNCNVSHDEMFYVLLGSITSALVGAFASFFTGGVALAIAALGAFVTAVMGVIYGVYSHYCDANHGATFYWKIFMRTNTHKRAFFWTPTFRGWSCNK
jgi:RHS repeat-associated protein